MSNVQNLRHSNNPSRHGRLHIYHLFCLDYLRIKNSSGRRRSIRSSTNVGLVHPTTHFTISLSLAPLGSRIGITEHSKVPLLFLSLPTILRNLHPLQVVLAGLHRITRYIQFESSHQTRSSCPTSLTFEDNLVGEGDSEGYLCARRKRMMSISEMCTVWCRRTGLIALESLPFTQLIVQVHVFRLWKPKRSRDRERAVHGLPRRWSPVFATNFTT